MTLSQANPSFGTSSPGTLFIVAAPSGAGKTSLVRQLLTKRQDIQLSVSLTTRSARAGEVNGRDYHFVNDTQFDDALAKGDLLEWANVHSHRYGTSASWVAQQLAEGKDVLLEIDWQGARQVREKIANTVSVFILPPSIEVLEQRLRDRGQDSNEVITRRLINARTELEHVREFEYTLINQEFSEALACFTSIIDASRLRSAQQAAKHSDLFRSLGAL